jgi:hypothetical protein
LGTSLLVGNHHWIITRSRPRGELSLTSPDCLLLSRVVEAIFTVSSVILLEVLSLLAVRT